MRKNGIESYVKFSLFLLLTCSLWSCKGDKTTQVALGKAVQGTFYLDIYEEGEIEAIQSTNITSPRISWRYGTLKITQIVKDGKEVQAGDTLAQFDASEVKKGVADAQSRLEMSNADFERLTAQQQSELEELNADYESTRISQEISKIKFESSVYEAKIDKKKIQLALEQANIALDRAKEQIENKIKIQKEDIKQKRLEIEQVKIQLQEANDALKKLVLISPTSGIAIINRNQSNGNKFQAGDLCWPGMSIIQLPDLSALRATVKINEVDISKIKEGLRVEIKPDAFSDSIYTGKVSSVANLAVRKDEKSKAKVFPVEIQLDKTSRKLLPGLSVSCRIIFGKINNALSIPLDAIRSEGAVNFVYKKTVKGYEKTIVVTGASNADHIIITKGLVVNDKVALTDPFIKVDKKDTKKADASKEIKP